MDIDDPTKPEFASWRSYAVFAAHVRQRSRYGIDSRTRAFLETVRACASLKSREVLIPKGFQLWRAQEGIKEWLERFDEEGQPFTVTPVAYDATRMKPRADRAREGRANPTGIPALYLASTQVTAISEIRPWVGSEVSLAKLETTRELRAIDLTEGHGRSPIMELKFSQFFGEEPFDAESKERAVWIDIDNAFSQPVTRVDDTAEYAPTQILAELFRDVGYDALIYRSRFGGDHGYNIVLFDMSSAEVVQCAPFQITDIEVRFKKLE